jgi:hypothetical protein
VAASRERALRRDGQLVLERRRFVDCGTLLDERLDQ